LLLVASESGHVYTFATSKFQPFVTSVEGKSLVQACLNSEDGASFSFPSVVNGQGTFEGDLQRDTNLSPNETPMTVSTPTETSSHPFSMNHHDSLANQLLDVSLDRSPLGVVCPLSLGISQSQSWACLLIAGRKVPKTSGFCRKNLCELQEITTKWGQFLGLDLVCMVNGLFVPNGMDSEIIHQDVVVGLRVTGMGLNQVHDPNQGPSSALDLITLQSAVARAASQIPDQMWLEISSRPYIEEVMRLETQVGVNSEASSIVSLLNPSDEMWRVRLLASSPGVFSITRQTTELYLVSTGGSLRMGSLVYGVLSEGLTQDGVTFPNRAVVGVPVADALAVTPIDLGDDAHEERQQSTWHLQGSKAYYLVSN